MGANMSLASLTEGDLAAVLAFPPLAWEVLAPDDPGAYEAAVADAAAAHRSPLDRLLGRAPRAPGPQPPPELSAEGFAILDLDDRWRALHALLCGSAAARPWPLGFLRAGGEEVGEVETDQGPVRALRPGLVRELAAALAAIGEPELRARFDPAAVARLHLDPAAPGSRDPADALGDCLEAFAQLQAFVARAAAEGRGLLLWLE